MVLNIFLAALEKNTLYGYLLYFPFTILYEHLFWKGREVSEINIICGSFLNVFQYVLMDEENTSFKYCTCSHLECETPKHSGGSCKLMNLSPFHIKIIHFILIFKDIFLLLKNNSDKDNLLPETFHA